MKKLGLFMGLALGSSLATAIETPQYEVELVEDAYEVRRYAPYLVAETQVQAAFDEAGNRGFRRLADYIFGQNKSQTKIAMTAPVGQTSESEKIAMTAPVGLQGKGSSFSITFSMPKAYTRETLPLPIDPQVQIREVAAHRAAALRYSGTWSEERYAKKCEELRSWMQKQQLEPEGDPLFARYNPPWMPWFLRHNEVIWRIKDQKN